MEAKQGTEGAKPDPEVQLSLLPDLRPCRIV